MKNIKRYFTIGIVTGVAVLGLTKFLQFGLKIIIARLGVNEFGSYYYLISLYASFITVASLGIPMSLTRFLAYYSGGRNKAKQIQILHSAIVLMEIISFVTTGILLIGSQRIAEFLFLTDYLPAIRILIVSIPFFFIILSVKAGLLGLLRIRISYWIDGIQALLTFICISTALLLFHANTNGTINAFALAVILTSLISIYLFRNSISFRSFSLHLSKDLLRYTWPVSISEILTASSTIIYLTLLKYYGGKTEVGLYASAIAIASLLNILPQIVLPIFLPIISTLYSKGVQIRTVYNKIILFFSLSTFVLLLLLLAGNRIGIILFFGTAFTQASTVLPCLLFSYAIYILMVWYNRQLLDMAGLTKANLLLTITRILVTTIILFWSFPIITGSRLALAMGIGWFIEGLVCLTVIHKKKLLFKN